MPSKTTNLNLNVDYDNETKVVEWREGIENNFKTIDNKYGEILTDIDLAINSTSQWEQEVADVVSENTQIYSELANKVNIQSGKSLVDDNLIQKLEDDYTKQEVDDTFVTKEVLNNTTITKEDINLDNYYTKSEVNGLITGGSTEALKDYYTKEEINDMIVGDADIKNLIDYLEVINGYEPALDEFDDLNGNGD